MFEEIAIPTHRGLVTCRWYGTPLARAAVLYVGGVGGGWDTPAQGLYPRLGARLLSSDIASLRIRFRNPSDLEEAVYDVSAGIAWLESRRITRLGFVGHSFGGAVVIEAAATTPFARAVVTLATQSYGTDGIGSLNANCAILLIHGTRDAVLPTTSSEYVYARAHEPKRLRIIRGAGHGLGEAAAEVEELVYEWLRQYLIISASANAASNG
jgi:dienelactone hydrolase